LLIKKVAEIARTMHQNGVNHRDFYICHFLLPKSWLEQNRSDVEPPLYVIDLHRTQVRSAVPQRWLEKDLAGLHFSCMDAGLTVRDRLRFISLYDGEPVRQGADPSSLWPRIEKIALKLHRKFHRRMDQ
jgi:heptose I phosphotransferase